MDEILERFENALGTREKQKDQHKTLYKNWGKFGNQEERRHEILQQQKSKRENKLDNLRGIFGLMESDQDAAAIFEQSSETTYSPNIHVPGFTKKLNDYNSVLMLSEWLIEKPSDFSTNWYVTPCPKGTRVLVIAYSGLTKCYTKFGQFMFARSTLLPGGNSHERWKNYSVLDCFLYSDNNTMYVLDVLSWNGHVMADGEMEFRQYWLKSKIDEEPGLKKLSKRNNFIFSLLPMIPCDNESLQKFMMEYPPLPLAKLDGLLFYHKRGHYVPGETPLVGWLYPYMVPEVLCPGMTIHELYEAGKPHDYVNQAKFIQQFEEKHSKRRIPICRRSKTTYSDGNTHIHSHAESTPQPTTLSVDCLKVDANETKAQNIKEEEEVKNVDKIEEKGADTKDNTQVQ